MKQIMNFQDPRFIFHRKICMSVIFILIVFILYPLLNKTDGNFNEIIQDILFYIVLILLVAETFYRRIRLQAENFLQNQMDLNIVDLGEEFHYENPNGGNNAV